MTLMRAPAVLSALITLIALMVLVSVVGGCASTPQADRERDAQARQFGSNPASSTLYVYRPDLGSSHSDTDTVLWIDGRLIGATLPGTFFRVNVDPGKHTLTGMGYDNGRLTIETRPGELYFIALSAIAGTSHFQPVPPEIGRKTINSCCSLLENWTPGQRPLLR